MKKFILSMVMLVAVVCSNVINCEASYNTFEQRFRNYCNSCSRGGYSVTPIKIWFGEEAIKQYATYSNWSVSDYNILMNRLHSLNIELDRFIFDGREHRLAIRAKDDELAISYEANLIVANDNSVKCEIHGRRSGSFPGETDADTNTFWFTRNGANIDLLSYEVDKIFYKLAAFNTFISNVNTNTFIRESIMKKNRDASDIKLFTKNWNGEYEGRFMIAPSYGKIDVYYFDGAEYNFTVETMQGKKTYYGSIEVDGDDSGNIIRYGIGEPYWK